MTRNIRSLLVILAAIYLASCAAVTPSTTANIPGTTPWTGKDFLNDPNDFQFVIVGDRTGGHRPEVFSRAMAQINLLQPEFVVCVGDLIEGYTEDRQQLDAQWSEFEGLVDQLEMPFFYTVGNHDVSNTRMAEIWRQRHGRDYYYFVYKNVLFISLNTEDPAIELSEQARAGQTRLENMMREDPVRAQRQLLQSSVNRSSPPPLPGSVAISDAQIEYVAEALSLHPEVRWTLLLMHKPAWKYGNPQFAEIEELLQDRNYTVIAGHEHYYSYNRRYDRDYIDMGTTGGIWLQDGPGRFDHIAWVTVTDSGPVIANIHLNGLVDKQGIPIQETIDYLKSH